MDTKKRGGASRIVQIHFNGTTAVAANGVSALPTAIDARISVTTVYQCTAGQYFTVQAYQESGGALNLSASGNESPEFSMVRLGN